MNEKELKDYFNEKANLIETREFGKKRPSINEAND
jgi:hypothetical protein